MKNGVRNFFSLMLNAAIVVCTIFAISKFFVSQGDANMTVSGTRSLIYFTNLSNILAALTALCCIPQNIKNLNSGNNFLPKKLFLFKYVGTVSVFVTFMTCVFFLAPTNVISAAARGEGFKFAYYLAFFRGNTFYLHFLTPIMCIISVVFFERTTGFKKNHVWLGLLPTVLYSIVYVYEVVIVGFRNGGWFDFYGFTFGGKLYLAPVSAAVMYAGTWLLARLLWKWNGKVNKKK